MSYLKGQGYKNLNRLNYTEMKDMYNLVTEAVQRELEGIIDFREDKRSTKRKRQDAQSKPTKKKKPTMELRDSTEHELGNYLRVVDFDYPGAEDTARSDSLISTFEVVNSKSGDYLVFRRDDESFRVINMLWDLLHVIDRRDLIHLYQLVLTYAEEKTPTGVGLVFLGDLTTLWETNETSTDDLWAHQEDWEIQSWRFFEQTGVHVLELEDGTMIYMLAERRYPLTQDLMLRMLDHGLEVEDQNETALTVIKLFIKWTKEAEED